MMQSMLLGLLVLLLTSSELISAKSSSPSITPSKRKRAPTTSLVTGKSTPASSDFAKETMSMHGNEDYLSDKEAEALFQANIKQVLMGKDGKVQLAAGSPTPAPTLPPSAKLTPPDCLSEDDELESVNGIFSATNTFLKCYGNIADPLTIPTFYNGTFNGVMMVSTNIQLNNLHEVDALGSKITMDFYLRLYWQDNRFNMPSFWKRMSPKVRKEGFELTNILESDLGIKIWTPDIRFHDAAELDYLAYTIRINATNTIFWSRHTIATYMQPKLQFVDYPNDRQIIDLRYGSYAYNQDYLKLLYVDPAISYNTNYDNSYTFRNNPVWQDDNVTTTASTYLSGSKFMNAIYRIHIQRKGKGVVVRLILPITLLCVLGGLTFWAEYGSRVDSTITLLLAVSALYIVILGNIPLLGYLTKLDKYVLYMFLVLTFAVVLHQVCATLSEKVMEFPLRLLMIRLVEGLGRVAIFPLASCLFATDFGVSDAYFYTFLYALVIPLTIIIFLSQMAGLRQSYRGSLTGLVYKVNSSETNLDKLTELEVFIFNLFVLKKISLSIEEIKDKRANNGAFINPLKRTRKVTRTVGEGENAQVITTEVADGDDPDQDFLRDLKHYGSEEVREAIQLKENQSSSAFDLNDIYQSDSPKREEPPAYQPVYY